MLERAVAELRGSGDEATYNYALYNLASAYLGAGRAAEAIPLLEERMRFDDGQLDEVEATLDRARAAAGEEPAAEVEDRTTPDDDAATSLRATAQAPVNRGGRFSANATTPSMKSAVRPCSRWASASASSCAARSASRPRLSNRLMLA